MNHSLLNASPQTHVKIVVLSLLGAILIVLGSITAHVNQSRDLARLQALLALLRLELHTLAFCKVAEALHLDLGLVNEEIIPAAVRRNKSEALFGVEPLNCTYTHNCVSLKFTHGNAGIHCEALHASARVIGSMTP